MFISLIISVLVVIRDSITWKDLYLLTLVLLFSWILFLYSIAIPPPLRCFLGSERTLQPYSLISANLALSPSRRKVSCMKHTSQSFSKRCSITPTVLLTRERTLNVPTLSVFLVLYVGPVPFGDTSFLPALYIP